MVMGFGWWRIERFGKRGGGSRLYTQDKDGRGLVKVSTARNCSARNIMARAAANR